MSSDDLPTPIPWPWSAIGCATRSLNSLTVISVRTQLLQRIAQQTPGLNDLERSALLNGLAAILTSAHELGSSLELVIGQDVLPTTRPPDEPA